jgi:purine-binding chemotaxis protein CheW
MDAEQKINSYLSFKLGEELFAANVSKVLNILEMTKITKVPKSPAYMLGVINLRGSVLPLVDTRIKFDLPPAEYTANTCILVLDIELSGESVHIGALVDSVQEVLEIEEGDIQPPPSIGSKYKSEFIEGIVKVNSDFVMLLNMDLIFSSDELVILKDVNIDEKVNEGVVENTKGTKKSKSKVSN